MSAQGFGFNLDGSNVTMWVDDSESPPLTDLQIEDAIRTLQEFRDLRNRNAQEGHKVSWREDISSDLVITGRNE